jgi:hypothetical protein
LTSITREECRKALAIAVDEVGDRSALIAGIRIDSTLETGVCQPKKLLEVKISLSVFHGLAIEAITLK